jgi:hypothetical protein
LDASKNRWRFEGKWPIAGLGDEGARQWRGKRDFSTAMSG